MDTTLPYAKLAPALKRAVNKAVINGWYLDGMLAIQVDPSGQLLFMSKGGDNWEPLALSDVLYDHDFAKALWGDEYINYIVGESHLYLVAWQYHLQQMVLADNPVEYLEENI